MLYPIFYHLIWEREEVGGGGGITQNNIATLQYFHEKTRKSNVSNE